MVNKERIGVLATVLIFHAQTMVEAIEKDTGKKLSRKDITILLLEEALRKAKA